MEQLQISPTAFIQAYLCKDRVNGKGILSDVTAENNS